MHARWETQHSVYIWKRGRISKSFKIKLLIQSAPEAISPRKKEFLDDLVSVERGVPGPNPNLNIVYSYILIVINLASFMYIERFQSQNVQNIASRLLGERRQFPKTTPHITSPSSELPGKN